MNFKWGWSILNWLMSPTDTLFPHSDSGLSPVCQYNIVVILTEETTEQLEDKESANKKVDPAHWRQWRPCAACSCGDVFSMKWNEDAEQPCHPTFVAPDMRRRWNLLVWWSTEGQSGYFWSLVSNLMNFSYNHFSLSTNSKLLLKKEHPLCMYFAFLSAFWYLMVNFANSHY